MSANYTCIIVDHSDLPRHLAVAALPRAWWSLIQNGPSDMCVSTRIPLTPDALKSYHPLPSTFPSESLAQAQERLVGLYKTHPEIPKGVQLQNGTKGVYYVLGRKEGEWFREWEERIRMGVRMRYVGELGGGGVEESGSGLDGY
jgi:hypothetical protein